MWRDRILKLVFQVLLKALPLVCMNIQLEVRLKWQILHDTKQNAIFVMQLSPRALYFHTNKVLKSFTL